VGVLGTTFWNPSVVLGPIAAGFVPALLEVTAVAIKTAPIRDGQLRRHITPFSLGALKGGIRVSVPYAAAQESGSAAHTIAPRLKRVLASSAPIGGGHGLFGPHATSKSRPGRRSQRQSFGPVAAVEHPGTTGKGWVAAAASEFPGFYARAVRRLMGRA
jgi:hypothetical protein